MPGLKRGGSKLQTGRLSTAQERLSAAAKEIARELIQKDDQRQGAGRARGQMVQAVRSRRLDIGAKAPVYRGIEGRRALEPDRAELAEPRHGPLLEPEREDLIDELRCHCPTAAQGDSPDPRLG